MAKLNKKLIKSVNKNANIKEVKSNSDTEQLQDSLIELAKEINKNIVQRKSLNKNNNVQNTIKNSNKEKKPNDIFVSSSQIKSGVVALLSFVQKSSKKNKLFNEFEPVLLQITPVRIPSTPRFILRMRLPYSLVTETSDICLFVPDLRKGRKTDHEPTIQHYEDLLRSKDVTNIKSIIPMRQVKVEYDQFELRRKLLGQYDFFLTDARISKHLNHKLGGLFKKKRKCPTPVRLDAKNLKSEINKALHQVPLPLHPDGDSHIVAVGHTQMKLQHICDNVLVAIRLLAKKYPGAWDNIRSLYLKTELSAAIPIYITLKKNDTVEIPVIKPRLPKAHKVVEGEISTVLNKKVKVYPDGNVEVFVDKKSNDEEDEIMSEYEGNEIDEESNEDNISENQEIGQKRKKSDEDLSATESSDEEEENVIEDAEEKYLLNYKQEQELVKKKKKQESSKNKKKIKKN